MGREVVQTSTGPNTNGWSPPMSNRELPSPELLRQLLRYDPQTGTLFWLPRPVEMFESLRVANMWKAKFENKPALNAPNKKGYLCGTLMGVHAKSHRIIWAMQTGKWPDQVDHIDGNRANNKFSNLREATREQNSKNRSSQKGSASKYLGVSRSSDRKRWSAEIHASGRKIFIGRFFSEDEAARAYDAAARIHHREFANLNFKSG